MAVLPATDPAARAAVRARLLSAEVVACHDDADGLSSGAQLLRARGESADAAWLPAPSQGPWAREGLPAGDVAILDLGLRALDGPAVLLDHHVPEAEPAEGQLAMTGHGEDPETSTSALVARVLGPDGGAVPWLAALGAFGDLGSPGLALPEAAGARRTAVRKLAPLVNAPRRLRDGPVRTALAILVESEDAAAALADPRIAVLEEAKAAWRGSFERAVRTAPRMGTEVALLLFDEPCRIHPLVATAWERRLRPRPVMAANVGWLEDGRVSFALRGGEPDADLRALLAAALPEAAADEFGHGHPRATGGTLVPDRFALLLERLGVAL